MQTVLMRSFHNGQWLLYDAGNSGLMLHVLGVCMTREPFEGVEAFDGRMGLIRGRCSDIRF